MDARPAKAAIKTMEIVGDPPTNPPVTPGVPDDATLVARLRDGDADAGEQLVQRHAEALLRYLQRLSGSAHLAEELHQQSWVSVMEHLGRFDARVVGGFKAWLYRIATNKANDHWRSSGRERTARQNLRLLVDEITEAHSERIVATETQKRLQDAINALPDAQKQVLLMRYYSGMKFTEIAAALGCPLNTALGRMHKAMIRLRTMMDDQER